MKTIADYDAHTLVATALALLTGIARRSEVDGDALTIVTYQAQDDMRRQGIDATYEEVSAWVEHTIHRHSA